MTLQEELYRKVKEHLSDRMNRKEIDCIWSNQEKTYLHHKETLNCRLNQCTVLYLCYNNALLVKAICPIKADAGNINAILDRLNYLNGITGLGTAFAFNFDEWTIYAKQYIRLSSVETFSTMVVAALSRPVEMLQKHGNDLARLLES